MVYYRRCEDLNIYDLIDRVSQLAYNREPNELETLSAPCQTFLLELFCENSERLLVVSYFCKKGFIADVSRYPKLDSAKNYPENY